MGDAVAESRSAASSDTDVYGVRRYRRELRDPVVDWWPSGWLLLAGLFLLFVVGMFFIAPAIQRSAQNAVVEALEAAGFTVAEVGGSGQRVAVDLDTLGNPTRALEQARAVARGAQCPSWAGALICPTRVTVSARTPMLPAGDTGPSTAATNPVPAASTETGPESGSSTAEARAPSRPHDFELRRDGERWTLRGETPDADTRLWLLARLRAAHPSVQAELEVTETAATPLFRPAAQAALKVLEPLERGVVRWSAGSLSLEGLVTEARQAEAEAGYAALSSPSSIHSLWRSPSRRASMCAQRNSRPPLMSPRSISPVPVPVWTDRVTGCWTAWPRSQSSARVIW